MTTRPDPLLIRLNETTGAAALSGGGTGLALAAPANHMRP